MSSVKIVPHTQPLTMLKLCLNVKFKNSVLHVIKCVLFIRYSPLLYKERCSPAETLHKSTCEGSSVGVPFCVQCPVHWTSLSNTVQVLSIQVLTYDWMATKSLLFITVSSLSKLQGSNNNHIYFIASSSIYLPTYPTIHLALSWDIKLESPELTVPEHKFRTYCWSGPRIRLAREIIKAK